MKASSEENTHEALALPIEANVQQKKPKLTHDCAGAGELQIMDLLEEANRKLEEANRKLEEANRKVEESNRKLKEAQTIAEEAKKMAVRESIMTDVKMGGIPYGDMLDQIQYAEFPPLSENDINITPSQDTIDASSVARSSERQRDAVPMRDFDYLMLKNPHLCPWSVIGLPNDDVIDQTCCSQLFDDNRERYEAVVNEFAVALDLLRNAFHYYHKKKNLTENRQFRAPFSLWFNQLLGSIEWCKANEYSVSIEKRIEALSFHAHLTSLKVENGEVVPTEIRGYSDMLVEIGRERILLSELKRPFGNFSGNAQPSQRRQAISQAYAELQGWLAGKVSSEQLSTTASATRKWFCLLGMDGITLRVFLATPLVRPGHELPEVYMSEDGNLSSRRYVRVILLAMTWMAQDHIDIEAMPKMGNVITDIKAADQSDVIGPSHTEVRPTQMQDMSLWDANAFFRASWMMRCELDEDEFWEDEMKDVDRLNAALNPSMLLPGNLARLGERKLTV